MTNEINIEDSLFFLQRQRVLKKEYIYLSKIQAQPILLQQRLKSEVKQASLETNSINSCTMHLKRSFLLRLKKEYW